MKRQNLESHVWAFHMVKTLCLLSLVFVHCFTFSNRLGGVAIESLSFLVLTNFIASLNGQFIFISGITFRLLEDSAFQGERRKPNTFGRAGTILIWLNLVELAKNILVRGSAVYIYNWDFLKTLLISFLLAYAISRIHVYLCFLVAAVVAWAQTDLHFYLLRFATEIAPDEVALQAWNRFHWQLLIFMIVITTWLAWRIVKSNLPKTGKMALGTLVSVLFTVFFLKLDSYHVTDGDYLLASNWLIWGTAGNSSALFPLLAWAPSFLIGYAGIHLVKRNLDFILKIPPLVIFFAAAVVFLCLYPHIVNSIAAGKVHAHADALWQIQGMNYTQILGEIIKVSNFLTLYLFLHFLNQRGWLKPVQLPSQKISIASFWIYLIATSWAVWIAQFTFGLTHSFYLTLTVNLATTLLLSWFVAELAYVFSQKRLHFVFRRGNS